MDLTFRSPFSYGISNSSKRLPRNGLLLYLARPNSDEYLIGEDTETGEDTYIWGYVLPDDADIRAATGWVNGTANVFYTATGVPVVVLATEIAAAILPANVVFSLVDATMQTGKLAIYTTTTTAATLAKARSVLRDESINYLFYGRTAIAYDQQDLTTMYQDASGTLPVYRPGTGLVDPPVGLMLDKGQGLELGPELVVNGDFSDGATGWALLNNGLSISGGMAHHDPLASFGYLKQSYVHVIGRAYMIEFDIVSTNLKVGVVAAHYNTEALKSVAGRYSVVVVAKTVNLMLYFLDYAAASIDNVSCREIKGYHAYQSTTLARPTLSGRYNLLAGTETLATQTITTVAGVTYTLRFEGTGTITLSGAATGAKSAGAHTITATTTSLVCTVAGTVTKADLRVKRDGSSLPAYQRVDSATTYDTTGFPLYLKRDRVDDDLIVQAPAITGVLGRGTPDGAVVGNGIIAAGEYHPLSETITTGLPEITKIVAVDGTLTASEQAVLERYLAMTSPGQPVISPAAEAVFSFGLTGVSSFTFSLRTKDNYSPVLVDWGDGRMSVHVGTTDQTAAHTYAVSGTYAVKVYAEDQSVLTRFNTSAGDLSGTLSLPSGMTYFRCAGPSTFSGTLSLPSGMTYFRCGGGNTLSGTLSLPSGMTFFNCAGYNTLSGTLSLPSGMTYFFCAGSNTLSGYTPSTKANDQQCFSLAGANTLSATDVDNILIDYAAAGGSWASPKEITIQGNAENRTSASDAAYASLAAKLTTLSVD